MIRHLFRMVWNRKRVNLLILIEIFLSFLVLFAVLTQAAYFYQHYIKPLGFDYRDVWVVEVRPPRGADNEENREQTSTTFNQVRRSLQQRDEVLHYGEGVTLPYDGSRWIEKVTAGDQTFSADFTYMSPGMANALTLDLVRGRWFEVGDFAHNWTPILVTSRLARENFPGEDVLGKHLQYNERDFRVIGEISDYRKYGELSRTYGYIFQLHKIQQDGFLPEEIALKMRPGTPQSAEESMVREIAALAPGWSFRFQPMERMRAHYFKGKLAYLLTIGLIAFFMLAMVAMGLVGVLWQNVTRRTSELGLRRAKGATRKQLYLQILGELLVITTLAIVLGAVVAAQVPILGLFHQVNGFVYAQGFAFAMGIVYLLAIIAGLYPSWLATRVRPAEALHYE